MTPSEFAIILSVVDNASRAISQGQEKVEGLARAGEHMISARVGLKFAGGLIREASDVLALAGAARPATSFHGDIARINSALAPTGISRLSNIQEFAIAQSPRRTYAVERA